MKVRIFHPELQKIKTQIVHFFWGKKNLHVFHPRVCELGQEVAFFLNKSLRKNALVSTNSNIRRCSNYWDWQLKWFIHSCSIGPQCYELSLKADLLHNNGISHCSTTVCHKFQKKAVCSSLIFYTAWWKQFPWRAK